MSKWNGALQLGAPQDASVREDLPYTADEASGQRLRAPTGARPRRVRDREFDFADFFENGALALHLVGPDGTILEANKAELDLLGYTADEYIGRHIGDFHADPDTICDILARLGKGEKLDKYPARLRARDGSVKHVEITSSVRSNGGNSSTRGASPST